MSTSGDSVDDVPEVPVSGGGDVVATAVTGALLVNVVTTPASATVVPVSMVTAAAATTTTTAHASTRSPEIASAIRATPAAICVGSSPPMNSITTVAAQVVTVDIESPSSSTAPENRAEFLSATLHKPNPESKLGITIAPDILGDIRITGLSESGSVQHSPLRVGDKLLSINGKNCSDMDNGVAGELLRSVAGTITIIVHNEGGSPHKVETMVEKAIPTANVGIGVHQTNVGTLNVSKVAASGLFAHSLVNVGDRVIAVNHVDCRRMDTGTVIRMIRNAPKYVTLLTETQGTAGVVLAAGSDRDLGRYESSWLNEDARRNQHHFCYCIWMIIVSLLVIGAIIIRPFG
uniref:PDZ domain-containing protein n=1 Tax=Amphora coffeiformis TaxID=265554 RepID=A0A7S3L2C7_9STRA|mmetsp:Transcript_12202/g.23344  ORF Transcript_12202/g.23344 Transcript_12202/m.23344 type:complete len:347 (+) Transcript_12202:250-1290(+)|eukprot:scaffold13351_cov200-Amphora_coffeaeformis.AAC.6